MKKKRKIQKLYLYNKRSLVNINYFKTKLMDFCTVEDLSRHFAQKLSVLNNAAILRNATADKSYIEVKCSLLESLDSVKLELRKMRREVDRAKRQLQNLEAMKTDCENFLQHLQFVVDNTPTQLPTRKHTENQLATSGNQGSTNSNVNPTAQQVNRNCSYLDFLTVDEFEAVPKYMKGRLKYERVNSIIEQLDKVFCEKYQILKQKTSSLSDLNRKRVEAFRQQEKEAEGVFIVEKDITDLASLKVDSNVRNVLVILRHCNILHEVRGGGHVRFATTSRW